MPDSGGSGPCHQGHARSYSTVEDSQTVSHDSGTWMECGVPTCDGDLEVSLQSRVLRTTQARGHGQFVTVVAVEKDGDGEEGEEVEGEREETCVLQSSTLTCRRVQASATQPVPKAAPRGFVTVVAVGSDTTSVHLDHTGTLTANLKLHLHPVGDDYEGEDGDSNYVNQEMIERERRNRGDPPMVESDAPSTVPDQVVVYRLPGERLGLGLKFDGGMGARECVKRLFIQSVAPDSPAARAAVPWGELQPGDQILNIEGCAVSSMTRVQCVSFLKDAAMKITIGVLKGNGTLPEFENINIEGQEYSRNERDYDDENEDSSHPPPLIVGEMRKRVPPPPLPPRARPRKSPARPPKDPLPVPPPPSAFQDMDYDSPSIRHHHYRYSHDDGDDREQSLQRWRDFVLSRRHHSGDLEELLEDFEFHHPGSWALRRMEDSMDGDMPPVPAFYHDLVGEEDAMGPCESESDETNSSVSTVIDRLSLSSSTTVSRNSSFNATADASRFDLARALSPFEQLEKELETENLSEVHQSSTPNPAPRDEAAVAPPIDRTTKPATAEAVDTEAEIANVSARKSPSGKMKMRPSIKSFSFSLKGRPFSWQQGKTHERGEGGSSGSRGVGRADTFLSIKRHSKRPAPPPPPPPPPPRSVETATSHANTMVTVTSNISGGEGKGTTTNSSHDESDDYIDLVAEAAKLGITAPVNVASRKKKVQGTASVDKEESVSSSKESNKVSPEYLLLLDSPPGGDVVAEFPTDGENKTMKSEGDDKHVEEAERDDLNVTLENESSVHESENIEALFKEKENDYVELIPAWEEGRQRKNESEMLEGSKTVSVENDRQLQAESASATSTMETEAEVHREESDSDEVIETLDERECESVILKGDAESSANGSFNDSDYICEGDASDEEYESEDKDESGDFNESDEDDEGSYVLEPDLYEDTEGFLSCSSPKVSPPILTSRRGLKLPSLIISEANEMGVYEDLYEGYSTIDDRPLNIGLERGLLLESRGLPSVPEEDSGEQDTGEEEDAYILYDDVDSTVPKQIENKKDESDDNKMSDENDSKDVTSKSDPNAESRDENLEASPSSSSSKASRSISQGYKSKRLRHDLGELIRREMNLEDDVTVEVEEEEEVESTVECANEEELLLVMRALRQDQPGDKLRWLEDESDEDDAGDDDDDDEGDGEDDIDGGGNIGSDEEGGEERSRDPPPEDEKKERETKRKANPKAQREQKNKKKQQQQPQNDPPSAPPPSSARGQSSPEDREEVAWARALSDPLLLRRGSDSPPPPPRAPPQTPSSPLSSFQPPIWPDAAPGVATTTFHHGALASSSALNSLPQGTGRHPHFASHRPPPPNHQSQPPTRLLPQSTTHNQNDNHHHHHPSELLSVPTLKASDRGAICEVDSERTSIIDQFQYEVESFEEFETLETHLEEEEEEEEDLKCQAGSVRSSAEKVSATSDKLLLTAVSRSLSAHRTVGKKQSISVFGSDIAMVARTDTNEAGKAATCPDDLQPISPMPLHLKQDMEGSYAAGQHGKASLDKSSPADSPEASCSSQAPLSPSSACGSEAEDGLSKSSSSDEPPEPPNYATHPECKGSVESQKIFEEEVVEEEEEEEKKKKEEQPSTEVIVSSELVTTASSEVNSRHTDNDEEGEEVMEEHIEKEEMIEEVVGEEEQEEEKEEEEGEGEVKVAKKGGRDKGYLEQHHLDQKESKPGEGEEEEEEEEEEEDEEEGEEEGTLCPQEDHHTNTGGGGSVSVSSCEHRYASSGGVPPPYSRLPPDGHEFPSSYAEGLPDKLSRYARYSRLAMELDSPGSTTSPPASTTSTPRTRSAPGTPLGPPPPIPRTSPTNSKTFTTERSVDMGGKWTGGDERRSREQTPTRGRWRRQDERSEKSVRDKIAMFSTDGPDQPHPKTRKLDKVDGEEVTMKRAFTEDDVRLENSSSSNKDSGSHNGSRSLSKTSAFSSMINVSTSEPKDSIKISTASSEVDIRQEMPPLPRQHELKEEKRKDDSTGLHSRSQSLIDIGRSSLTKRHSVGAYDRPSVYQYGIEKPEEKERRTSLSNLIEQRRKSLSKLRGLVIPESRSNEGEKATIDLPKISSVPPSANLKTMSLPREGQRSPRLYKADSISSIDSCESNTSRQSSLNAPPWKSHNTSTLPKYSPAFKRKNMAVFNKCDNLPPPSGRTHSNRSTSPTSDLSQASPVPPAHTPTHTPTPPRSLETITTPSSEHSFEFCENRYSNEKHSYSKLPLSQKSSLDSRLSRAEDSDNDSAVSSTQSSFSQGLSPPSSPMPEHEDHDDRRYRSYRSRLSPQNSYDDQEAARRVLKRGSIEAENRRNVLNSARCSSGRSSDEQLTPEIIRKFSTDKAEENGKFPKRLDSELREGPKTLGLRRHPSTSSTSSAASSHRSSHDSSRRNSRDSVIHIAKHEEVKVSAEPVYFDQEGEMYKESQLKVAYLNEIMDDFEQLHDPNSEEVIAEIPLSSSRRVVEHAESIESTSSVSSGRKSERWAELEMKYGSSKANTDIESKIQRLRRTSDSISPDRTRKNSDGFRALAERWQQRAEEETTAPQPQQLVRRESASRLEMPARRSSVTSTLERPARPSRLCDDPSELDGGRPSRPTCLYSESTQSSTSSSGSEVRGGSLDIPRAEVPDRKLSMPEYGSGGIKLRERREGNNGGAPSRPTSLIEGGDNSGIMDSHYMTAGGPLSPTASTDSRDDLYTPEDSLSRTGSKEVLDAFSRPKTSICVSIPRSGASNTPKMSDIMRAFERHELGKRGTSGNGSSHPRMSSLDSTASDDGSFGAHYGSVTSLASGQRDQYGSITSLASSTSLISPQELAQLIEEANQSLEESGTPSHEILVVVLHREIVGHGSIGITLAGGADYEAKEITVHKVIPGSLADRDGRIQRGDRVLSINGKNLRGVTHREALNILKSPRPEVVLVLSRSRSVTPQESNLTESDGNFSHRPLINHVTSPRPPKILESPMDSKSLISEAAAELTPRGPPLTITLMKDGAGLGFSLEGGKDSPLGDRPLTVKKIFSGGAADKGGILKVGDELVSVNTVDVTGMARIEAWNFLKKLPDGTVSLVLRQKLEEIPSKNEE